MEGGESVYHVNQVSIIKINDSQVLKTVRRLDHSLTQDLDRRLCPIGLLDGHAQIVDEHQHLLVDRRSEHTLSAFVQLAVDDVLRLVRGRLGGKGEGHGGVPVQFWNITWI